VNKVFSFKLQKQPLYLFQIYAWLDQLVAANSNVKIVSAGKTTEGREIRGIEITNGANLPGAILESGIHAREWIGPAATSWIINQILNSPEDSIWRQYNYVYFPVTNPDGYEYTWNTVSNLQYLMECWQKIDQVDVSTGVYYPRAMGQLR